MTATIGTGPVVREGTATAGGGTPSRSRRARPLIAYGHWWWALPAIVMVLLIHYIATAGGAFYAFTNWTGIGDFDFVGLDNFKRIFEDPALIGSLKNTLFLAFGFLILTNVLGLLLALAVNRTLKSRYVLRVLLFMPVVLSPLAVSYIW
jgi:raffinose/stachyose/melibiose transport system permease protein